MGTTIGKSGNSGSGGSSRRARRGGRMAEINVTPFVDVMLVLLVIFMVTAPLISSNISLDLPQSSSHTTTTDTKEHIVVSLDKAGKLFVQEQEVSLAQFQSVLLATANRIYSAQDLQNTPPRINIKADQAIEYSKVIAIMDLILQAGFAKIGLTTQNQERGIEGQKQEQGVAAPRQEQGVAAPRQEQRVPTPRQGRASAAQRQRRGHDSAAQQQGGRGSKTAKADNSFIQKAYNFLDRDSKSNNGRNVHNGRNVLLSLHLALNSTLCQTLRQTLRPNAASPPLYLAPHLGLICHCSQPHDNFTITT